MNTNEKKMRGRPKGSNSFTGITLAELNAKFSQDQTIPVGRLFLEKGNVTQSKYTVEMKNPKVVTIPAADAPKIEMSLSE